MHLPQTVERSSHGVRGERWKMRGAPPEVTWVELDGTEDRKKQLMAGRVNAPGRNGSVLIIGDSRSPSSQREFASLIPGAVTVEAVDLKDLVTFARRFKLAAPNALRELAQFAQGVMSDVGADDLIRRIEALDRGRARKPATDLEKAALRFTLAPSYPGGVDVLVEIGKQGGVRAHRPAVLRACIKALQLCHGTDGLTFADAAIRMREQNRLVGRPLPGRAVGSTLLLKGLEAEVAVVLNADSLDRRNLYVAMTRGSKRLTICSKSPVLKAR
jgi:DNA helicase-2/ATP-dependent DNA helicase PcrA